MIRMNPRMKSPSPAQQQIDKVITPLLRCLLTIFSDYNYLKIRSNLARKKKVWSVNRKTFFPSQTETSNPTPKNSSSPAVRSASSHHSICYALEWRKCNWWLLLTFCISAWQETGCALFAKVSNWLTIYMPISWIHSIWTYAKTIKRIGNKLPAFTYTRNIHFPFHFKASYWNK